MPKKPQVPFTNIEQVLFTHKDLLFNESGRLKKPSDDIWKELAENFGVGNISSKYLYVICNENRYNILEKIAPVQITNSVQTDTECLENNANDTDTSDDPESFISETLKFNITLSHEEWLKIQPMPVTYHCKDRLYKNHHVFSTGAWTDILALHFWEQTKLGCPINFKRSNIHPDSDKHYIQVDGYCKECNSNLTITLDKIPHEDNERVVLTCSLDGKYILCPSKKKRYLKGENRMEVISKLRKEKMTPSLYRQLEARKIMNFGDKEPAILPSGNVLRTALAISSKNDQLHEDVVVAIGIMKTMPQFNMTIKDLGYDPFFVHYWSPLETVMFKDYVKNNKEPTISIDATGGLAKKPILISKTTCKTVFLYEIVVRDDHSHQQYSVSHMLSSKHDNISISYWLSQWQKDVEVKPKIIVTDQSLALLYAVVKTFTHFSSLQQYLEALFVSITENRRDILPHTYLRLDIAHIIKMFCSWPPIKNSPKRVKEFYVYTLAQMTMSTSYSEVLILMQHMFNVMLSETEGTDVVTNKKTTCEESKLFLKSSNAAVANIEMPSDDVHNIESDSEHSEQNSSFEAVIEEIANNSLSIVTKEEGDRDNMQYLPSLRSYIIKQSRFLPLWTKIMAKSFDVSPRNPSSCGSESSFNNLKNRVFSSEKLPLRADVFLNKHIKSIEGQLTLACAGTKQAEGYDDEPRTVSEQRKKHPHEEPIDLTIPPAKKFKSAIQEVIVSIKEVMKPVPVAQSEPVNKEKSLKHIRKEPIQSEIPPVKLYDSATLIASQTTIHPESADEMWKKKSQRSEKSGKYIKYLYGNSSTDNFSSLPILKNGNLKQNPLQFGKNLILVQNTCAFDSLFQILACAYIDSENFRQWVSTNMEDKTADNTFWNLIEKFIEKGATVVPYRLRASMAKNKIELEKCKQLNNLTVIDMSATIRNQVDRYVRNFSMFTRDLNCSECNDFKSYANIQYIQLMLADDDMNSEGIERRVEEYMENIIFKTCFCGMNSFSVSIKSPLFLIDLLRLPNFDETHKTDSVQPIRMFLTDLPNQLNVLNDTFFLVGVVVFFGNEDDPKNLGHYLGIAKRDNIFQVYDDLKEKASKIKPEQLYTVEFLVYLRQ